MNTITATEQLTVTNSTITIKPRNIMKTPTPNPAKALCLFLSAVGLTIALSATAQPAAPAWIAQANSFGDFYWASSAGADHYEIYIDGGTYAYNISHNYNASVPAPKNPWNLFGGFPSSISYPIYPPAPTPDGFHTIQVLAVDAAGNKSDLSPGLRYGGDLVFGYDQRIFVSSPTVAVNEYFTLQCIDNYFDQIDLYICPDDGSDDSDINEAYLATHDVTLVTTVNTSNYYSTHWNWDGHDLANGEEITGPEGWWLEDNGNGLEYYTEGTRLMMKLSMKSVFINTPGAYICVGVLYGDDLGSPRGAADHVVAHITVTP